MNLAAEKSSEIEFLNQEIVITPIDGRNVHKESSRY